MPFAVAQDGVRLYFEEAGSGTPIIFLHEFAADHTNWELQMRISRASAAASPIPPAVTRLRRARAKEVYTYRHFYTDALAVLDHLEIDRAHFVGLSMGAYSSLQIGLHEPERALSLTLAASARDEPGKPRSVPQTVPGQWRAIRDHRVGRKLRKRRARRQPDSFLVKDPRGHADFYAALARHDAKGSANTMRSFQGGRPSIFTLTDTIRKVPTPALIICGDEDDNCVEPSLFLKQHLPAAGLARRIGLAECERWNGDHPGHGARDPRQVHPCPAAQRSPPPERNSVQAYGNPACKAITLAPQQTRRPPVPLAEQQRDRRHEERAHEERVDEQAERHREADLEQRLELERHQRRERAGQDQAGRRDHAARPLQAGDHRVARRKAAPVLLADPGHQEDVVVDAQGDEEDEAKIVRFGSESGWPNTCVKISDDAPSANANDRITVPITYSGATMQRSSAISTSRIRTSTSGTISFASGAAPRGCRSSRR